MIFAVTTGGGCLRVEAYNNRDEMDAGLAKSCRVLVMVIDGEDVTDRTPQKLRIPLDVLVCKSVTKGERLSTVDLTPEVTNAPLSVTNHDYNKLHVGPVLSLYADNIQPGRRYSLWLQEE